MRSATTRHTIALICAAAVVQPAFADSTGTETRPATSTALPEIDPAQLGSVTIIGSAAAARDIGGSAHFVGPDELDQFDYGDVHRILRAVPGIYLQDEEGFGHRPNIGIRGSGQDRSARIAILEDGVMVAPAPYAAPAAYYFPNARRIYAAEVLKGPASIPVGPRTVGGAVNLISAPIPSTWALYGDYFHGDNATHDARIVAGGSTDRLGLLVETVQQQSDGFKTIDANDRNTKPGYDFDDWMFKARLNTDAGATYYQSLEFKYQTAKQDAQQSYLGLTDADFAVNPFRLYAATQIDQLETDFTLRQLSWSIDPATAPWQLTVTRYDNYFDRSWERVNSVDGIGLSAILADPATFADELAWLKGADSPDNALRVRDNKRSYGSKGVQANGQYEITTANTAMTLKSGVRVHEDYEDRFQTEDRYRMDGGNMVLTTAGVPGAQENRVVSAEARAGFVAADVDFGAWRVSPGLRYERIELTRKDYAGTDPTRADGPTRLIESTLTEWIPGIALTYSLGERIKLIGGVHKGFNPPAPGSDASAETSTNWEFGLRYEGLQFYAEAIAFITDYDNLVGTVTESTGGGNIGDQFEAGTAVVRGLELLGETILWQFGQGWRVPARLVWTWTPTARFDNSFASDYAPWGTVESGFRMPYLPEHVGQLRVGLEGERLDLHLNFNYQSEARAVAGSGSIPSGQRIESAMVVDVGASWRLTDHLSLQARVQNLFDKEYIASRSPNGARPGIDRWALVGLQATF